MKSKVEQDLAIEINLFESTEEDKEGAKSLEVQYDLYETVKTFNDFLCLTFLHLCNILTYPNESLYEKYEKLPTRISPDDGMEMANKICARMQAEYEDII